MHNHVFILIQLIAIKALALTMKYIAGFAITLVADVLLFRAKITIAFCATFPKSAGGSEMPIHAFDAIKWTIAIGADNFDTSFFRTCSKTNSGALIAACLTFEPVFYISVVEFLTI